MADLSAVYRGSRSIRAGIIWLDFPIFGTLGVDPPNDFDDNIGVVMLMEGRLLKAAGSMSGMVIRGNESATASRAAGKRGAT